MPPAILSNLGLAALIVFSLVYLTWIIHLLIKDSSIIDLIWGAGFGLVAAALLYTHNERTSYHILLATLPIVWAIRYTNFIWRRNTGNGEDPRYTILRERIKKNGQSWPLFSFFMIYGFQSVSMLLVCAPLIIGMAATNAVEVGILSILGALFWLIGFFLEAVADAQLNAFKRKIKDYKGPYEDKPVMDQGLWRYSRHPNYFGNACMWWGIGLIACSAPWGWIGLIGSAYMNFCLVFLTGKANNESKMKARKAYQDYILRTSGFIPMPPKSID
jgi:steroid 5-alpha reductase family enzyme